jgi:hypothetical protein
LDEPTASVINAAVAGLTDAIDRLIPAVDTTSLAGLIALAEGLAMNDAGTYTQASVDALISAIGTAQDQLGEVEDQAVVDHAAGVLQAAVNALQIAVRPEALQAAIDAATSAGLVQGDYTAASWSVYTAKLNAARALVAPGQDPTQTQVDQAVTDLRTALAGLVAKAPVGDLSGLVAAASAMGLTPGSYTPASWAAYTRALAQANGVAAKAEPTAAEIAQARTGLNQALAGLVPAVTAGSLTGLLQIAAGLGPVQTQYTPTSWKTLADAITTAQAAASEADNQSVVDQAAAGLRAALTGLRLAPVIPDTTGAVAVLTGLVGNAERLAASTYTPESWQVLAAAVAAARVVAAKPGVTPGETEQATAAVGQALAGLVPATVTVSDEVPPVPVAVWQVKTAQKTLTVKAGQSVTLPAGAYLADGSKAAVKVTWKTAHRQVATVTAKGKITGKKTGKTTNTHKAAGKTTTVKVTVVAKSAKIMKAKKVKATGVPKTMTIGQVKAITGSYTPVKATKVKITYKSTRPAIVTVDKNGIVQAKAAGTAKVTIKAGKVKKTYTIRVN